MLCGTAAAQRVKRLAEQALQHSDAVGTLETGRVHRALRKIIVERFFKQQLPIDVPRKGDVCRHESGQARSGGHGPFFSMPG